MKLENFRSNVAGGLASCFGKKSDLVEGLTLRSHPVSLKKLGHI